MGVPPVNFLTEISSGPGLAFLPFGRCPQTKTSLRPSPPNRTPGSWCAAKLKNIPHKAGNFLAEDGSRTHNLRFTKPLLCQLSYLSK